LDFLLSQQLSVGGAASTFSTRKDEKCLGEQHAKQRQDVAENKKM